MFNFLKKQAVKRAAALLLVAGLGGVGVAISPHHAQILIDILSQVSL